MQCVLSHDNDQLSNGIGRHGLFVLGRGVSTDIVDHAALE